jgi:hypothetical protein
MYIINKYAVLFIEYIFKISWVFSSYLPPGCRVVWYVNKNRVLAVFCFNINLLELVEFQKSMCPGNVTIKKKW